MILLVFSIIALLLAALPVALFYANLQQFRVAPDRTEHDSALRCSILIPARDEERSIRACVESALSTIDIVVEVVVLDDHSADRTPDIVREIALQDSRLRLESAPPLPAGWCGKQHACHVLSQQASYDHFLFIDADLRLTPDAAGRAVRYLMESRAALVSAFPRQITGSLFERLLIPLIHVVLLGYLPLARMRQSQAPALSAGCGQFFVTRRAAYLHAGGHAAIKGSMHDGITLPRAYRKAGLQTDVFDGTDISMCHMYRNNIECWHGLSKNATEGLASPGAIVPWTILLIGGHVLPFALLIGQAWLGGHLGGVVICALAVAGLYAMRLAAVIRFRESWTGALLHPAGVMLLVAIQWYAFARRLAGRPSAWKSRAYSGELGVISANHGG